MLRSTIRFSGVGIAALLCAALAAPVVAQVEMGIQVGPKLPEPAGGGRIDPSGSPVDFDDVTAPCVFSSTVALTSEYSAEGVVFSGPGGMDGGARLDECGEFGVNGHSSPNFLAFNVNAIMSGGGNPEGPETMTFSPSVSHVAIKAGHNLAGTITMECFDAANNPVGSDSITATDTLLQLVVDAPAIRKCVVSFSGDVAVFDDLVFELIAVPAVSRWASIVLSLLLATTFFTMVSRWRRRSAT